MLYVNRLRAQGKGLAFEVDYDDRASGDFLGDITRIKQVFGNLLANGVKFTSQGHVLARVGLTQPDEVGAPFWLTIEVEDTGCGFSPQFGEALFNRFAQADTTITRRFGGTGLGLSICKSLVEMMGGQITARSEPGHGSVFQVFLPLRSAVLPVATEPVAPKVSMPEATSVRTSALRVLLAEDHPINQRVVQLILAPQGAKVTTVENGAQALEAIQSGVFDVVLMDMQMPIMDGLAATRAIRDLEAEHPERARTPIVMLSANAMVRHRQDAISAGADLHLSKPVTAATLIAGIGEAMHPQDQIGDLSLSPRA